MKSRSSIPTLMLVAATLLLASCASPPKVRVDKDTSTNFASYKSFGWLTSQRAPAAADAHPAPGQAAAPAAPEMNSLTTNRVRNAVAAVLQAKGYVFDEAHPDFRVGYALNVYEHQKDSGMRIGLGAGGGGGHAGGSVGVSIPVGASKNLMGTMTIDIIDGARNAQVWTGSYEQKVQGENISDEDANRIVSMILTYFPHDPPKK